MLSTIFSHGLLHTALVAQYHCPVISVINIVSMQAEFKKPIYAVEATAHPTGTADRCLLCEIGVMLCHGYWKDVNPLHLMSCVLTLFVEWGQQEFIGNQSKTVIFLVVNAVLVILGIFC